MYTRHDEVPIFEIRQTRVEAVHYNLVCTALKRLQPELRMPLPQLKTLDLILQPDAWIVVDRAYNDLPIVAWTQFQVEHRAALHTPIECQLRLFHANGGMILKRALEAMRLILGERLRDSASESRILDFNDDETEA